MDLLLKLFSDEMYVQYVRPQDCGNRTSVRWTAVTGLSGTGILVSSDQGMNFSALHYSPLDLEKANHPYELNRQDATFLTIDLDQCGLGGGSCGPPPLQRYWVASEETEFKYSIKPYVRTW